MAASLSREFLLLAACSVWPPSNHRATAILEGAAGSLDWERFLRLVKRHQIAGLAHEGLASAGVALPASIAAQIKTLASELSLQSLTLTAEAARLQQHFATAGVPLLSIKGPSLATLAYGNLALRESKDLDVLVPYDRLSLACELLQQAGYRRVEPPETISDAQWNTLLSLRKDFNYWHQDKGLHLELHWRLLSNPHLMSEGTVMSSSREVTIANAVKLRTLGSDDLFSYLCAHGAVHWWYQLKWLADIGALLANESREGVERLYRAAEARGCGQAAAQALLLCHRVLGTDVPLSLIEAFQKKRVLRWLEATALYAVTGERRPAERMFGTTRGSISCFLLGKGSRYRAAELKVHLVCESDVLTLALPKPLQFLYPMLRLPLWLWRQLKRFSAHGAPSIQ